MATNPLRRIDNKKKLRILLIQLEFPTWQKARSWSYAAQLAYEEGLIRHDVSFLTLPLLWGIDPSSPQSWQQHARNICRGKHFDQVWVEIVHSPMDYAFMDWLSEVAPVRVGFVPESLEYDEEVYSFAPYLQNRKAEVEQRLSSLTHLVAADEEDVAYFNSTGKINAMWWPAAVPQGSIRHKFTRGPRNYAVFYGDLYGDRSQWLSREDLAGLLVRPPAPEIGTPYPKRFDELHKAVRARLSNGKMVHERDLNDYITQLRRLRQECFELWLKGLNVGCAVVNLPHFLQTYPGRVVESMAAGVPVISWEIPDRPLTREQFEDGKEILLFDKDNPEQLVEHILNLRKDEELARFLVDNARENVIKGHTTEVRVKQILDWISETAVVPPPDSFDETATDMDTATGIDTAEAEEYHEDQPGNYAAESDSTAEDTAYQSDLASDRNEGSVENEVEAQYTTPDPTPSMDDLAVRDEDSTGDLPVVEENVDNVVQSSSGEPNRQGNVTPETQPQAAEVDPAREAERYLQVVRENPDDVDAWVAIGAFALDLDDESTARTAYRKAFSLEPGRQDVRTALEAMRDPILESLYDMPDESDMDAYYTRLFGQHPNWSKPHPNQDEAARWAKISALLRQIAESVQKQGHENLRILDLGCGRGWMTNLASEYGECEGVDPVANVIDMARAHFPGLRFYAGTAETVRFQDDFKPYDVVMTSEVIEHVPNDQKSRFIDDILTLLKPDGHIILTTPRREALEQWRQISHPGQPVEDWLREKDVRRLFTKKGMRIIGQDQVHQDITTREFMVEPNRMINPDQNVIALYQVWAVDADGKGRGYETLQRSAQPISDTGDPEPAAIITDSASDMEVITKGSSRQSQPMLKDFRVVAIISAYNEGDVIYHVIGDLIKNGVKVYLIDNCSTDNTVEEARRWMGKGLLHIERFPDDSGYDRRNESKYVWRDILRRKEELTTQIRADWFIHADADEFRESPWPDMSLCDAMHYVDALGYNAVNFELLNFKPVDNNFRPGDDVREHLKYYEPGELFNATQIKAWKHTDMPIQLAQHGGHAVVFEGRRVFPVPFIVRHYPIRGETHGHQKVFRERKPRFAEEERAMQWHVQYDDLIEGNSQFVFKEEDLIKYDGSEVRAQILSLVTRDILLMETLHGTATALTDTTMDGKAVCSWVTSILNERQPIKLSSAVQANEKLDQFLQVPLDQQKNFKPDVPVDRIPILQAMAQIKKAQAILHGNSLTVKRLEAIHEQLDDLKY